MHRVLLVDDEPLVRNVLWSLSDWSRHGFELHGEAGNGDTALAMIERSRPHIAIIDVNMPGMNGVELQRTIRERHPSIQTIMLSSYDDYDYVRECLKNGAVDYLLKHRLDEAALLNVLNKAALNLRQGDREESVYDGGPKEERTGPALVRETIADLARGAAEAASMLESAAADGWYPHAVRYAAAAVQIVPFLLLTESYSDAETNRLVRQAVDVMQTSLGDVRERTAAYVENGRIIVVLGFKERSEHAVAAEAGRWMRKLQHSLELFLNLKCVYAVGHACGSLSRLGASYASAERALDVSATVGPEGKGAESHPRRASLSIEEQKQLVLSIERLDEEGVRKLISSVFASLRGQPVHSLPVQSIAGELLRTGDKARKKGMPASSAEALAEELPSRGELRSISSLGELEEWLLVYYSGLLKLLKQRRAAGPYSRHVSQAIHYILERYPSSINLEQAAGAIGLNPSYLSRIFKEETRTTFTEYLNRVRIDASCKLLESGQYSVKQISNLAGFSSPNYFFKVFKELTGLTPQAYLNGLAGGPRRSRVKKVE